MPCSFATTLVEMAHSLPSPWSLPSLTELSETCDCEGRWRTTCTNAPSFTSHIDTTP